MTLPPAPQMPLMVTHSSQDDIIKAAEIKARLMYIIPGDKPAAAH